MKWIMPETTGKKRWEVGPCIITLDIGEKVKEVAIAIIKAAIKEATPGGLGLITAFFHEASEEELFSEEAIKEIRKEIKKRKMVNIDYWTGRAVKLILRVIDRKTLHISLNTWADRLPICLQTIPKEAIDDLQNVLEVASGKKESTSTLEGQLAKGFVEDDRGSMILEALEERMDRK